MSLPKLAVSKFTTKLPSTGQEVTFRPFLVSEEKILLMAKEARDVDSQVRAVKDIIDACVDDVDVTKLPYFDVEYLFLQLRAKSVGEVIEVKYKHRDGINREGNACDTVTTLKINLDEVKVSDNPDYQKKFMITEKYGVVMKYPTITEIISAVKEKNEELALIAACIETVYDENDAFVPDNLEDAMRFVGSLTTQQFDRIKQWYANLPYIRHTATYKCPGCGQEDTVTFDGVADFF